MEEVNSLATAAVVATKLAKTASPKKRKEGDTLVTATAATRSKKGRADNKNSKTDALAPLIAQNGQGVSEVNTQQKQVQFSFGSLPLLSLENWSKATILICKRSTVQQLFQEGSELIFEMLGLSVSPKMLQAMKQDVGNSKNLSVSIASTYVDHPHQPHRWTVVAVPDVVSRSNHPWSVHAITDAVKSALGSTSSTGNTRVVFCGTDVVERMGSLAAAIARAFNVYSRKSNKSLSNDSSSKSAIPTVHISFLIANEHGIHEKEPENCDFLQAVCESIQLAARLVDMVRCFSIFCFLLYLSSHVFLFIGSCDTIVLATGRVNDNLVC
jgi:hypothetical protein